MCKELLLNNIVMQSALYDLPGEKERQRSNTELANLFANIITNSKIDSFFEIGALNAEFSMFIKDQVKNVVAFEASPRNYKNAKNSLSDIEYLNMAVSDIDGEIDINVAISAKSGTETINPGADSILSRINNQDVVYKIEKVLSTKLDTFIKNKKWHNKTNALWIDVEGASLKALLGAENSLDNTKVIFIEMEQATFWKDQALVSEVNKFLCNKNLIPIARDFEYENQFNVVYVSEDILYSSAVDISLQMFYAGIATKGSGYVQKI
jgi:FkbM family methyltransferase